MAFIFQENPWEGVKAWKKIVTITFTGTEPNLTLEPHTRNRILNPERKRNGTGAPEVSKNSQDDYVHISFKNLKFEKDEDGKRATAHIKHILTSGIVIGGRLFLFCGHSNSQLKNRGCFMMAAKIHADVTDMINSFADFSNINDVAKRCKRIGLGFTSAEHIVHLAPMYCTTVDDIEFEGMNFTDGCGLITQDFANTIFKKHFDKLSQGGLSREYKPSVFQVRYQGKKGNLAVVNKITASSTQECILKKVAFRPSMHKFDGCTTEELYVVGFSMPSGPAYLNSELVSLLSTLGVPDHVFETRLEEYFAFIHELSRNKTAAIKYLQHKGGVVALKQLYRSGRSKHEFQVDEKWLHKRIKELQCNELETNFDKNDIERVHIRIPLSRLLYGVCDTSGLLLEGQCFVRYTTDIKSLTTHTVKGSVVVGRNPCFHPGDVRVFTAVDIPELRHLVDCIVFSTTGTHPPAAQMSGGDLDGDKFFVSWDRELIPLNCVDPFDYSSLPSRPHIPFVHCNHQLDLINYFAESNYITLGKLTSFYWDWIRMSRDRAFPKECLDLNVLFSRSVDGEDVEIPENLSHPPKPRRETTFILDILTNKVRELLESRSPP